MHKSRLSSVTIDCENGDLEAAARFWGEALGRAAKPQEEKNYVGLADRDNQPLVLLQRVTHSSRVHLDIETDDVEAEVKRLEALGARRVEKVRSWWVMAAPTGHRFCVVEAQRGRLADDATVWP